MTADEPGISTISEDLQTRYAYWKKNTKLLYDYLNTNTAKWPSLTCQFFPDVDANTDTHRILLSSYTSCQLPEDENVYVASISTLAHLDWASLNNFDMDEMEFKPDRTTKFPPKNLATNVSITFPRGDCNRARYMPQNPDVIAAASSNGAVYVFNRTKHGTRRIQKHAASDAEQDYGPYEARFYNEETDEARRTPVDNEAVSLAWNHHREGTLAVAYSHGAVKVWDLQRFNVDNTTISETEWECSNFDSRGVNDVSWMSQHDSILAACGERSDSLALFDTRAQNAVAKIRNQFKSEGINACKFNWENNLLLASTDSTGRTNLWDVRKLSAEPIVHFDHGGSVSTLEWNPHDHSVLATAGQSDGLIKIWDTSLEIEDKTIFVHSGHMLGVNDIAWDLHDPWLMCSVSNDNSVHVWKPAANLVQRCTSP
ncbi:Msi1p KNAG_0A03670 [Huiozyma naganishii CBS 8797]|uniref:Uncharacterized protein n=1 Tax=Huiozyma naganishii (strain ATCC MYA-139 / BCRC 22969 / CBS 8797 / KCTC 17520 / NBRC 10181 / NCYC 3082 / Yp74L-3) TaxID=1071383 RepID=J7RTI8_HUIN7|nr:hypothetical protein KNAG_0A03670 [Kazachstania naganishii CBS 8797]CCK68047.1 hypothetical protein KNAG_0A03670 [Kazachstania naganishii CBS 8797]